MDGVLDGLEAQLVGGPVGAARRHAATRHPKCEALGVVVPAIGAAAVRRAPELPAPDHQRLVEHAARREVVEEGRDGLVDGVAVATEGGLEVLVLVPSAVVQLDEANARLGQSAREEALPPEVVRAGRPDTVPRQGVGGFRGQVEQPRRLGLHAEGELEGLDDALDLRVAFGGFQELTVHVLDEPELPCLLGGIEERVAHVAEGGGGVALAGRADGRALVHGGQEGAAMVLGSELAWGRQCDEAGQVFVLGAKPVQDPCAHGGPDEPSAAGVKLDEGLRMVGDVRVHRAHDAQPVCMACEAWHQLRHPQAGVPMLAEGKGGPHELVAGATRAPGLAMVPLQPRLGIEQVELRGPALHAQEDHAPGHGLEVRHASAQRRTRRAALPCGHGRVPGRPGRGRGRKPAQRHPSKAGRNGLQQTASAEPLRLDVPALVGGIHGGCVVVEMFSEGNETRPRPAKPG